MPDERDPYITYENEMHRHITLLQVTNRIDEQTLKHTGIPSQEKLKEHLTGKKVLISGGSLNLMQEKGWAVLANEIDVIDPTHGLDPEMWTVEGDMSTSTTTFTVYYVRRGSSHDKRVMTEAEFKHFQQRRRRFLPSNLRILPRFLPPLGDGIVNVNTIIDCLGPLHYISEQNKEQGANLLVQYVSVLAHFGIIIASHLHSGMVADAQAILASQGINIAHNCQEMLNGVYKKNVITRLS